MENINISYILSQVLYCLSGYFFGICCCRYGVLTWQKLMVCRNQKNDIFKIIRLLLYGAVIAIGWLVLPLAFYNYNQAGGFVMLVTIIYYLNHSRKLGYLTMRRRQGK